MIPKIVHLSWKDKDVVNSQSGLIKNGLRNLIDLNPDWRVEISTDAEVDAYLKDNLGEDYALVEDAGIVAKTDIWRLIKLFKEGGLYIDIDRFCNVPLNDLIDDSTKWVLPTCGNMDFSHDFMMSEPGNPVFANTINIYLNRRKAGHTGVYFLGAQTYMHGVTYTLFGQMINSDPGEEAFEQIREHISKIPFIKTYRENPPADTIIYKGDVTAVSWEAMKRQFYSENQIKHWTGEW